MGRARPPSRFLLSANSTNVNGQVVASDGDRRLDERSGDRGHEPAHSVSFHLRALAKAGMVVEAPEHARVERDRVWRDVAKPYQVDPNTPGVAHRLLLVDNLPLTAAEAKQFGEELVALQERWTERTFEAARSDPSTPREIYQLLTALGPRHEETDGTDG